MAIKNQLRQIIQWEHPEEWEIFRRFTNHGDEIKNASSLILQAGQGCIFTYEGKIEAIFEKEGLYKLKTDNIPFITTIKKFMNFFESDHKVGLWFYRNADIVNIRWGTRIPITYNDPVYRFPVNLRSFGNYSIKIIKPEIFFTNIIAGKKNYYCGDLQELFLSRIMEPISNYLANAKFSYADIDSNIELIAKEVQSKTNDVFTNLGFTVLDFRIEGTSFDEETNKRIAEISDVQADAKAADLARVDFAELQKLKALRDVAKNEGATGTSLGMLAGINMSSMMQDSDNPNAKTDVRAKLKELKELFEEKLISEEEYRNKKQELLKKI